MDPDIKLVVVLFVGVFTLMLAPPIYYSHTLNVEENRRVDSIIDRLDTCDKLWGYYQNNIDVKMAKSVGELYKKFMDTCLVPHLGQYETRESMFLPADWNMVYYYDQIEVAKKFESMDCEFLNQWSQDGWPYKREAVAEYLWGHCDAG